MLPTLPNSPLLLHEIVQSDITSWSEQNKKDSQQRNVRPPEWLDKQRWTSRWIQDRETGDYLSSQPKHWQNSSSRKIKLDSILKIQHMSNGIPTSVYKLTLISFNCKYRSSFTASASNAAWKNEIVCSHWNAGITLSRLINKPVNNRLLAWYIISQTNIKKKKPQTWIA